MGRAPVRVKICGITRVEDAALAVDLGASALGLVFWPESPRALTLAQAAAVARAVADAVHLVGVFVNPTPADVSRVLDAVPLGAVQLHGDETIAFARAIERPVVKGVTLVGADARSLDGAWPRDIALLVDAHDPVRRGGTGRIVDWAGAAELAGMRPIILSGGLTADNVAAALDAVRPWAIDVSSGVEITPGIKDAVKMRTFFAAVAREGAPTATSTGGVAP